MSGEPASSPVLVLSGRICSEVFGVIPTRVQSIIKIKPLNRESGRGEYGYRENLIATHHHKTTPGMYCT